VVIADPNKGIESSSGFNDFLSDFLISDPNKGIESSILLPVHHSSGVTSTDPNKGIESFEDPLDFEEFLELLIPTRELRVSLSSTPES